MSSADYLKRVAAAQATLDHFLHAPFAWGSCDCARLAAHCLRELGRPAPLSRFGRYSTQLGAAKALRKRGFGSLCDVLDDLELLRIPPAAALPADIVAVAAEDLPVTIAIALGNRRVLGFHGAAPGAVVFQPNAYVTAWSSL